MVTFPTTRQDTGTYFPFVVTGMCFIFGGRTWGETDGKTC